MSIINYKYLLNSSKSNLDDEKNASSEFYANLFMICKDKDITTFLTAASYKSYNLQKLNQNFYIFPLAIESIRYMKEILSDSDSAYCIVKVLFRLAQYCFSTLKNYFFSYYLLSKVRIIFEKTYLKKSQTKAWEVFTKLYNEMVDKIDENINNTAQNISENKIDLDLLKNLVFDIMSQDYVNKTIEKLTLNSNKKEENIIKEEANEENDEFKKNDHDFKNIDEKTEYKKGLNFYIISKKYISQLNSFLNNPNLLDKNLYSFDKVLESYCSNQANENCAFPGPISNFNIFKFDDYWNILVNPMTYHQKNINLSNESNTEISNKADENLDINDNLEYEKDYLLIYEEHYALIKSIFNSDFDSKRILDFSHSPNNINIQKHAKFLNVDTFFVSNYFLEKENYNEDEMNSIFLTTKKLAFSNFESNESFFNRLYAIYNTINKLNEKIEVKLSIINKKNINMLETILFIKFTKQPVYLNDLNDFDYENFKELSQEDLNNVLLIVEFGSKNIIRKDKNYLAECAKCNKAITIENRETKIYVFDGISRVRNFKFLDILL